MGFYTYHGGAGRYLMDLYLGFRQGKIEGDGADGLDRFVIAGVYDERNLECRWEKIYPTRPAVQYTGYREGKGIWGTWKLANGAGGFHIWPLAEGGPPDLEQREEEKTAEVELMVPLKPGQTLVTSRSRT